MSENGTILLTDGYNGDTAELQIRSVFCHGPTAIKLRSAKDPWLIRWTSIEEMKAAAMQQGPVVMDAVIALEREIANGGHR